MKKIKDYSADGAEEYVGNLSIAGILFGIFLVILALSVIGSIFGFVGGWFGEAKRVISPANVKAQWQFAYDYDASLKAIGRQWCSASAAEKSETDPGIKSSRTNQRLAIENNYQRVEAEYDGRLRDAFRAKFVKPPDVPAQAPTLEQNTTQCRG